MVTAAALAELNQALIFIGFGDEGNRDTICEDAGLLSFEDFVCLTEKDIRDMAEEFSKRTVAHGRISFGLRHITLLLGSCTGYKIKTGVIGWRPLTASKTLRSLGAFLTWPYRGQPYGRWKTTKSKPSARLPTQESLKTSTSGPMGSQHS